jgi:hypothetical protein
LYAASPETLHALLRLRPAAFTNPERVCSRRIRVPACTDDKSTWNRLTSLYANRTGLIGTPIRVKSGSHGFTYELTFVDPGHAEVKHSFSGAPITFTDERELVIGVQMNTQTKTMRTIRQVLVEEAAPKKEKKAETAPIPDVSDAFTPTAQGFKSEMINKGVEWSQLEAASSKAKGMLHVPLEERMAAYAYTLDSPCLHGELNAKLRKAGGPMPLPAGFENCTSYLERSIQSLPLPSGQDLKAPLYRGQPELYGVAYQANDIVVWPAFTSTTTEYATAEAFRSQEGSHQGVLFEVFGINEKDGGGLAPISKFPCEAEILVQAGTAFRVLEKTMSGNKKVIKLAKVDS